MQVPTAVVGFLDLCLTLGIAATGLVDKVRRVIKVKYDATPLTSAYIAYTLEYEG